MPSRSKRDLNLTSIELAVLFRIYDNPGIHAFAISGMIPGHDPTWLVEVCRRLYKKRFVRRGRRYWAHKGGYPRTPLFLTKKGQRKLETCMRLTAGIEELR